MIEKQVADALTRKPIKIVVDVKPKNYLHSLFQKWKWSPVQKEFELLPLTYANVIRISAETFDWQTDNITVDNAITDAQTFAVTNGNSLATIVATIIHNGVNAPNRSFVNFVKSNFTMREMMSVVLIGVKSMEVQHFITTIALVKGMNILKTTEASPETNQGS